MSHCEENNLSISVDHLSREVRMLRLTLNLQANRFGENPIKEDLEEIMKAITTFAERQNLALGRIETAVGKIVPVAPADLSTEDQATLDGVATRTESAATAVEALVPAAPAV